MRATKRPTIPWGRGRRPFEMAPRRIVSVAQDRVAFEVRTVPPNLSNFHGPAIRPSKNGPSRAVITKDWRNWAVDMGKAARLEARWPFPEEGEQRRVSITFFRAGQLLDDDGAMSAAKPTRDGLQRVIWRQTVGPNVIEHPGAGLIYSDDLGHLPTRLYHVEQIPVGSYAEEATLVVVERLEVR